MLSVDPAKTALLLMDFQNRIIGMVGDQGPALLERAQKARMAARAAGMAVMYVRVAFSATDYAAIPPRNKSFTALAGNRFLTDGSPEADIHADLTPAAEEEVFTKTRVGAFSTTDLQARLKARGIDTLVLPASPPAAACSPPCATPPITTISCSCSAIAAPMPTPKCIAC